MFEGAVPRTSTAHTYGSVDGGPRVTVQSGTAQVPRGWPYHLTALGQPVQQVLQVDSPLPLGWQQPLRGPVGPPVTTRIGVHGLFGRLHLARSSSPPPQGSTSTALHLQVLAPGLARALPASQRLPALPFEDFPRPGRPSFATFRNQAPRGRSAGDVWAALDLATGLLNKGRTDSDGPTATFADNLFADLRQIYQTVGDWPVAMVTWGTLRAASADGPSVLRYFRHVAGRVRIEAGADILSHPMVVAFSARIGELRGNHVSGTPAVILQEEYLLLLSTVTDPLLRALIILAWKRMARVADILEVRHQGLWLGPSANQVWVESPFSKTGPTGQWDRYLISLTPTEYLALLPYVGTHPPTPLFADPYSFTASPLLG